MVLRLSRSGMGLEVCMAQSSQGMAMLLVQGPHFEDDWFILG